MRTIPGSLISFQPQTDALTYEPFFGLKEQPFSLHSDPRFLYASPSHAATFENLLGGIRRREGLLVLTGEIGIGKTTLCRAVLRNLGRKTFSSFVPDPFASREDLLKRILIDFGVISIQDLTTGPLREASRTELSYLLAGFLESLEALDAFVIVIIDEAQNMSLPLIEETRILSDSFGGDGRLQIVFVGQLELHEKLQLPEMRQVDQRVCGYHRLAALSRDAVAGYIQHRLHVAGGSRERVLFSPEGIELLHGRSGGVPRLINRICDRALHLAHRRQAACVDREILETALLEVGPTTLTPTWASIAFPEAEVMVRPSAASAPAVPTPEPPTAAALAAAAEAAAWPVEHEGVFSQAVDEWLTQELPQASRELTRVSGFATETRKAPAQRPAAAHQTAVSRTSKLPSIRRDMRREPQGETYLQKVGRTWAKRAVIAAVSVVALGVSGVVVSRVPSLVMAPAVLPPLPAQPPLAVQSLAPPPAPPIEAPQAAASGDYLVAVGLFASPARADLLVEELTQEGLPAVQRPFQLRTQRVQQVVLGPFANRSDAVADLQRLRQLGGYDDANVIVTLPNPSAP